MIKKKWVAAIGTVALALGITLTSAPAATAWGSGAWNAGCPANWGANFTGSSWYGSQNVYVSLSAPYAGCGWGLTGYVQGRKNPSGLSSRQPCSNGGCEYTRLTLYSAPKFYWGGVHYFNNRTAQT